jgi:hypothetical protein
MLKFIPEAKENKFYSNFKLFDRRGKESLNFEEL